MREARGLGDSWFSYAYLIDRTWIFRFPREDYTENAYRTERLLLPLLAPSLEVATPDIEHVAKLPDGRTFMGHKVIPGVALTGDAVTRMIAAAQDAVAHQIAEFLRAMHGFPLGTAREIGVDEDESGEEYAEYHERTHLELHTYLRADECAALDQLFEGFLGHTENLVYNAVVTHSDLWEGCAARLPATRRWNHRLRLRMHGRPRL